MSASFPTAIPTDNELLYAERYASTLTSGVTAAALVLPVAALPSLPGGARMLVQIEDEVILVSAAGGGNLTVPAGGRGYAGTSAVEHASGKSVKATITWYHHNRLVDEVEAIAASLGAELTGISYAANRFDFTAQSPAAALSIGVDATITLAPVPWGVNWNDENHPLLIVDAVAGNEVVTVKATGPGTATGGAASGTLTITGITKNHASGDWSIQTATAGIQEAICAAPAEGSEIMVPAGDYVVYAPITSRTGSFWVRGAGEGATVIRVAATQSGDAVGFPLTAEGVFISWLSTFAGPYVTGGVSMSVSDLAISFYQPDSLAIGDYIHWPPAIYGEFVERAHFDRLEIMRAWDGIFVTRGNGFYSRDCKISCFHHMYDIDGLVDTTRIDGAHQWVFGLTTNQNVVMMNSPAVYGFWIGKADDCKISNSTTLCPYGADIHDGVALAGIPWVAFVNVDFDNGGIVFGPTAGGRAVFVNCQSNVSTYNADGIDNRARAAFAYSGVGEVYFINTWFAWADANATKPMVDLDFTDLSDFNAANAGVSISNSRFYNANQDRDVIYALGQDNSGAGKYSGTYLLLTGNEFAMIAAEGAAYVSAAVHAVGLAKVVASGNNISNKKGGTGAWFIADTDCGHAVVGNSALGWTMTYPATQIVSAFRDNAGVTNPPIGAAVASAATIVPTGRVFHITGTTTVSLISPAKALAGINYSGLTEFTVIPDGAFDWNTGNNIAIAGTAVVGKALTFTYDSATAKYYPSYV